MKMGTCLFKIRQTFVILQTVCVEHENKKETNTSVCVSYITQYGTELFHCQATGST